MQFKPIIASVHTLAQDTGTGDYVSIILVEYHKRTRDKFLNGVAEGSDDVWE